jgi:uncharacterized delta-60 repeat protein
VLRIALIALALLAFVPAVAAGDGTPDPSFGQSGSLSIAPQRFSSASGVAVDGQGRTLVGAMLEDGSMLRTQAAVLRLLADGSLDAAFGNGGVATISAPAPYRTLRAESMALDALGRVVFAGEVDENVPAIWRVLQDGTLDPAFGSGGFAIPREAYGGAPAWWQALAFDARRSSSQASPTRGSRWASTQARRRCSRDWTRTARRIRPSPRAASSTCRFPA